MGFFERIPSLVFFLGVFVAAGSAFDGECPTKAQYTLKVPYSMRDRIQAVNESRGVSVFLNPAKLKTICGVTLGDADTFLDPPDIIQEMISMTIGMDVGVGRLDQEHIVEECGTLSDVVGGSTSDFVYIMINERAADLGRALLVGADADRKKQARSQKGGQKKKSLGSRFRGNMLNTLDAVAPSLPLCMAVRPCAADFSISGKDIGKEFTFGLYSGGGITLVSAPPGCAGCPELTFHGLAAATAGDLVPMTFVPSLWGDKAAAGMHLWMDGSLGFPLKRLKNGAQEMIGALSLRAQFGAYGSINGSPRIGEFLNALMGCDGADVDTLFAEFALDSALVQLFGNAQMVLELDLEKLLNLAPGTVMEIGADASFFFEFAKTKNADTFDPVTFDVWSCSSLPALLTENVWVAALLSEKVYRSDGPGTPKLKEAAECSGSGDLNLTIFRLEQLSPIPNFNAEIHFVKELNTVVVAFRGSDQNADWLTNLDFAEVPCTLASPCGRFHKGFQDETEDTASIVRDNLFQVIAAHPDVHIGITGHSLGGALAQGFAMWMCGNDAELCHRLSWVNVFGAPMVCGDGECMSKYESLLGPRTKRFVNACGADFLHDPVVSSPPNYQTEPAIQLPSPDVDPSPLDNYLCHAMEVYVDAVKRISGNRWCEVVDVEVDEDWEPGNLADMQSDPTGSGAVAEMGMDAGQCVVQAVPDSGPLAFVENAINRILNPGVQAHIDLRLSAAMTIDDVLPVLAPMGKFGKFLESVLNSIGLGVDAKALLRMGLPGPVVDFGLQHSVTAELTLNCAPITDILNIIQAVVEFVGRLVPTLQGYISDANAILDILQTVSDALDPTDTAGDLIEPIEGVVAKMEEALGKVPVNFDAIIGPDTDVGKIIAFTEAVCIESGYMSLGFSFAFIDGEIDPTQTWIAADVQAEQYKFLISLLPSCGGGDRGGSDGASCLSDDDCASQHCNLFDLSGDPLCIGTCVAKRGQWNLCTAESQCEDDLGCCSGMCVEQQADHAFCLFDCQCSSADGCILGSCGKQRNQEICANNADCESGMCVDLGPGGLCSSGADGNGCINDGDCNSGICVDLGPGGLCSSGANGNGCINDDDCNSGKCVDLGPGGLCSSGANGNACASDGDCNSQACFLGFCVDKRSNGELCDTNGDCTNNDCEFGICGGVCTSDTQCGSSGGCYLGFCVGKRSNGGLCDTNGDCTNNDCEFGICGGVCTSDTQCGSSGGCVLGFCTGKRGPNGVCDTNGDCQNNNCCGGLCLNKVGDGTVCAASCACSSSDGCVLGTCGKKGNGSLCTSSSQCSSGSCKNGVCNNPGCRSATSGCSSSSQCCWGLSCRDFGWPAGKKCSV